MRLARLGVMGLLGLWIWSATVSVALAQTTPAGIQEYIILGRAQQEHGFFQHVATSESTGGCAIIGLEMVSVVTFVATSDGQTVYYDQWEDGFEADIFNPQQLSTTQVFNLNRGQVVSLKSDGSGAGLNATIPLPRNSSDVRYDGGDRIVSVGGPVNVVHAMWPLTIDNSACGTANQSGVIIGDAWEIYSRQAMLGFLTFPVPVGEDSYTNNSGDTGNYAPFKHVVLQVGAFDDNTTVSLKQGVQEETILLNRGQTYTSLGFINETAAPAITVNQNLTISATSEIEVGMMTGSDGGYQTRFYNVIPSRAYGRDYLIPVRGNNGDVNIYMFNPSANKTASVTIFDRGLPANGQTFNLGPLSSKTWRDADAANRSLANNGGGRIVSDNLIWGVVAYDYTGTTRDWGFSMVPARYLKNEYYVSWAPVNDTPSVDKAGNPIWVAAVQTNTTVQVDLDNNGTFDMYCNDGDGTSETNLTTLNPPGTNFDVLRIYDPYDGDMTGAHIVASGPIALVYGQDSSCGAAAPYLDLGYSVLPLTSEYIDPILTITGASSPTSVPAAGGTVDITMTISTGNFDGITGVDAFLKLPYFRHTIVLNAGGYTNAVAADVGRTVVGGTSGHSAKLLSYNNGTRTWVVDPNVPADIFHVGEALTITGGTGRGNVASATAGDYVSYVAGSARVTLPGAGPVAWEPTDTSDGTARTLTWDLNQDLNSSDVIVITLRISWAAAAANTVYSLTAGADGNYLSLVLRPRDTFLVNKTNVSVTKSVDLATATYGDVLTYSMTVANGAGAPQARSTVLRDPINEGVDFVAGSCVPNTCTYDAPNRTVYWTVGDLNAGSSWSGIFQVRVRNLPEGAIVNNLAYVLYGSGAAPPPYSRTDSDEVFTQVLYPTVEVTKSAAPTVVAPGDNITYTLTIRNTSGAYGATNVVVRDVLDSSSTYIASSMTLDTGSGPQAQSDALDGDVCDYNNTVAGGVAARIANLPAGASYTWVFSVQAKASAPSGDYISNLATSEADNASARTSNLEVVFVDSCLSLDCDDGNVCTDDSCDSVSGCINANNAGACDDGDFCTSGDTCAGGVCVPGVATNCDDGNPCTDDTCDGTSGACQNTNNSAACDDGNLCTQGDVCSGGVCQSGTLLVCDDFNPCTDDSCNPADGSCSYQNNTASCDDGNACTTNDTCAAGACVSGAALNCDDNNPCTDDSCDPATGCQNVNDNTNTCSDNNACTVNDTCVAGACLGGTALNCNDNNPCTDDSCDPASGCANTNNTLACDDGNACTTNDTCAAGACVSGAALNCNDNNPCTDDSCDPASGCVYTNNSLACDDNNACTTNDTCAAGACVGGTALNCNDNNSCTDDSCDPASGCMSTNNTLACDDGNACTVNDICAAGACVSGAAANCDDGNPCTDDACDPVNGCINANNDTNPCSDSNACTTGDVCSSGLCVSGTALNCDDGNVCTDDSCDPATGCVHGNNTLSCSDGNACTVGDHCAGGACTPGTTDTCNDTDPCTVDSCDSATGCSHLYQDTDGDEICDALDPCPFDPTNTCVCSDRDGDGICDAFDLCPDDPTNNCGTCPDQDNDGICDVVDPCPTDPTNQCQPCEDTDHDGLCNGVDPCPTDPTNQCTTCADTNDNDHDGKPNCVDPCPDDPWDSCIPCNDQDHDGICDAFDPCPADPTNTCTACLDRDHDGICDIVDPCPDDPTNTCQACTDTDQDGLCDDIDPCPADATNTCDACRDTADPDNDGEPNCVDPCPTDPTDSCIPCADRDIDGLCDSEDPCPDDPTNTCIPCPDRDQDNICDAFDPCPDDPTNTCTECSDRDLDGICDIVDSCPDDPTNTCQACPDRDQDGLCDLVDPCPDDPTNTCSACPDPNDNDNDGRPNCVDPCPDDPNDGCIPCADQDHDGLCDFEDPCPDDPTNACVACSDRDHDGICDAFDICPDDPTNTCQGCIDSDDDGMCDAVDPCPHDPLNLCVPCPDRDHDGLCDTVDPCPDDPTNTCSACPDTNDNDNDGKPNCVDPCPDDPYDQCLPCNDRDHDGICDNQDLCPDDPTNSCQSCSDRDHDGLCDVVDPCPDNPDPACSCDDLDDDGLCDDVDPCPNDPTNTCDACRDKNDPDGDGKPNCVDPCPNDSQDTCLPCSDRDNDGICDAADTCPDDPNNTCDQWQGSQVAGGGCGCGSAETDGPSAGWMIVLLALLGARLRRKLIRLW